LQIAPQLPDSSGFWLAHVRLQTRLLHNKAQSPQGLNLFQPSSVRVHGSQISHPLCHWPDLLLSVKKHGMQAFYAESTKKNA
jgi:hypothetical protein